MTDHHPDPRRRVHFEPTVTLGHLIQVVGVLVPLFVWGVRVETAQAKMEERAAAMQREIDRNEAALAERLRGLQSSMDRIEIKLDQKADKPVGGAR